MRPRFLLPLLAGMLSAACSSPLNDTPTSKSDLDFQNDVVRGMHDGLLADMTNLVNAAKDIQSAAPAPADRGWDATADADAINAMKAAWAKARTAYEHIEGATAPIFPDIDVEIDERYDGFLADPNVGPDQDLFDDQGVTGMHAIERILYSDVTPQRVIDFEKTLTGYKTAAFPATADEASEFKNKLCAKLVTDTQTLHDNWQAATHYDLEAAFDGLVSLMNEQREKVDKAATNEEESRYAQTTMQDIRDNLAGTKVAYGFFQPWIQSKKATVGDAGAIPDGNTVDGQITSGFATLDALYGQVSGNAIPDKPEMWSSENPSADDLMTPFGKLFSGVRDAVDPNKSGSVVFSMNQAAVLLGYMQFVDQP